VFHSLPVRTEAALVLELSWTTDLVKSDKKLGWNVQEIECLEWYKEDI